MDRWDEVFARNSWRGGVVARLLPREKRYLENYDFVFAIAASSRATILTPSILASKAEV
jgi:hypothetical protein